MDGDGYFTNLLSNGNSEFAWEGLSPVGEQSSQNVDHTPSLRPNQKRTKNFSRPEDELLVSAWLNTSIDPIQGTNQTRGAYWKRIHEYFHSNKEFQSDRSENSLFHRWKAIQEGVNKFCGCISRIESRRQSGVTIEDKLEQAKALYEAEDINKKSFILMHCYVLLRTQPKWHEKQRSLAEKPAKKSAHKKQKTASESSPPDCSSNDEINENATLESEGTQRRPMGRKRAKEALRQGQVGYMEALDHLWAKREVSDAEKERKKDDRFKEAYALQRERIQLEQVKVENKKKKLELMSDEICLKRMIEEERIMTMDFTGLSDIQQQFYKSLQNEIVARHSSKSG